MIPLPAYVDSDAWAGFVEMRRRIRAPLTVRAATLVLYELQRIKDAGHCPNAALDQSTMRCWRDVWPMRDKDLMPRAKTGAVVAELREHAERPQTAEERARASAILAQAKAAVRVVK